MASRGTARRPPARYTCKSRLQGRTRERKLTRRTRLNNQATVAALVYRYLASATRKNLRRTAATNMFRRRNKRQQDVHRPIGMNQGRSWLDSMRSRYSLSNRFDDRTSSARSTSSVAAEYAKAVSEGRKRARNYICKALSFGVYSGYLVPTDHLGKGLRLSPDIKLFSAGKRVYRMKKKAPR